MFLRNWSFFALWTMTEMSHVRPSQHVSLTDINHVSLIVSGGNQRPCAQSYKYQKI